MHRHITYYVQSTVSQSVFYERISSNKILSSSPWAYAGFARGGGNFLGSWTSGMPRSDLQRVAFVRGAWGHASPNFFLNGAIWCVLEHIFIHFYFEKV